MANWGTNSLEIEETTSHKAGELCSRKGRKKEKLLQHGVYVIGHSSRCELRRTGLNFVERTRRSAVLAV